MYCHTKLDISTCACLLVRIARHRSPRVWNQESLLGSDGEVGGEFCLFVPCDTKKAASVREATCYTSTNPRG